MLCLQTGGVYLVEVFPAGRGEGGSKERYAEFLRFFGSRQQTVIETRLAAFAAFRFVLQALHGAEPRVMSMKPFLATPVIIVPDDTKRGRMALGFVLADLVLLERVDIRIKIVNNRRDMMRQQPLYDGRRTRCTTGM